MVMEEQDLDMELVSESTPVPKVQEVLKSANKEVVNKVSNIPRIKPRLRKKALHAAILKQMEFYFSDANLSKDRFLSNLIKQDPEVDLHVFTKFNKIRELTTDVNRITKALEGSTMLSVTESGSKVYRTTPFQQKENADECTIYVQNLPPDSDHEWLVSVFSRYGSVAYVSIPRYKSNRKIKGFAFVEFDEPDSARKCIAKFEKRGCVLPLYTSPESILSITTFDDAEKDVTLECQLLKSDEFNADANENNVTMDINNDASQNPNPESNEEHNENKVRTVEDSPSTACNADSKSARKRKHNNSEVLCEGSEKSDTACNTSNSDAAPRKKKHKHSDNIKLSTDLNEQSDNQQADMQSNKADEDNDTEKLSVKVDSTISEPLDDSDKIKYDVPNVANVQDDNAELMNTSKEEEGVDNDRRKDGKKKKRKRRSKGADIDHDIGLKIMAKKDWKHLRNKYLELQRSKMKQLKQHLRKARMSQWSVYNDRNKTLKEDNDVKEQETTTKTSRNFSFTTGTIVKIEMSECCTDPKNFKTELRGNSFIKYIDVSEGSYEAYVRCETPESAQTFAQKSTDERQMEVLQGDEERAYLDKILHDRKEKLENKVRYKQRGRNKLLKRAEKALGKHIKFDEV